MGFMGSCPIAGVVWQHVHYLVGLQRLGHEVYYIEDSARIPYNPVTFAVENDYAHASDVLAGLAREHGFEDRWAFHPRYLGTGETSGLPLRRMRELYKEADAILNVCGSQEFNEDLAVSDRILYVESDPGVEQIKVDQGVVSTRDYLARHHALFTFGEHVPTPAFPVPLHDFTWRSTRQPVVTDLWWDARPPTDGAVMTTIANWQTGGKKDISWRGDTYLWSKSEEFLKFLDAPGAAGETLEMATDIKDPPTRQGFLDAGWRLTSPYELSHDFHQYRDYIRASRGEFTVAKDQYVRLRTGWFSDRTACYLAAGRPAITQETGFSEIFGQEGGLFGFRTLDDIRAAAEQIRADYPRHCRLAAEVAREFFEAEKVLARLLDDAGI